MRPAIILAGLCLGCLPAAADTLLEQARSVSREGPEYLFDMIFDDGKERFTFRIDQTRPEGERVVGVTPEPASLAAETAKRLASLKEEAKGDIWCSDFADSIPQSARRVSETAGTATYSFTPLPGDDKEMRDIVKYLTGKVTIDKANANILSYELTAPRSFKPMVAAKVDQFDMKVACKAGPDGRSHVHTFVFDLAGSAMMQRFSQTDKRQVANLIRAD